MAETFATVELQVGPQGRVVIPATLRRAWKLEAGEVLLAHLEEERLVLEKPAQVLERVKARFAKLQAQPSLADELIADRRLEAKAESAP